MRGLFRIMYVGRLRLLPLPEFTERFQTREGLQILWTMCRTLARNDVIRMAYRKTFHLYASSPRVLEAFDSIRREHYIQIEWPVLKLNEVFPALDLRRLRVTQCKPEILDRFDCRHAILPIAFDKQIGVLCRIGKAKQNCAGFTNKKIAHPMP